MLTAAVTVKSVQCPLNRNGPPHTAGYAKKRDIDLGRHALWELFHSLLCMLTFGRGLLDFILLQAPAVTFPDDFPNSVRHFLLIGFLASFICAIVFFYMGYSRKNNTVMHAVLFFVCAITAWYIPAFPIPFFSAVPVFSPRPGG